MNENEASVRFAATASRLALCCALLLAAIPSVGQHQREAIVTTQSSALRVREAPSLDARVIAAAERNERVVILDSTGDRAWYRVQTVKGDVGWVSAQFISVVQAEPQPEQPQGGGGALLWLGVLALVVIGLWLLRKWTAEDPAASTAAKKATPPPPPANDPESAYGSRAAWAVCLLVVASVVAALWYAGPSPRPPQPGPGPTPAPTPVPTPPPVEARAIEACRNAMAMVEPLPNDTPEERDNRRLEVRWIQYLADIQARGDHANWSGEPCDLYVENHRRSSGAGVHSGLISMEVYGKNLQTVTVRVTLSGASAGAGAGTYIVVPTGTLFASSSGGTQNMMAAENYLFSFAPVPAGDTTSWLERVNPIGTAYASFRPSQGSRTLVGELPAYCINRWRDIPGSDTQLTVSYPGASEPLPRLISCLEKQQGEHNLKQRAVWMVSDNLLALTPGELEDRLYDELTKKSTGELTGTQFADILRETNPSISEDMLRQARSLPRQELARYRGILLRKVVQQEDLPGYKATEQLLQSCGIDVVGSVFFRK